MHVRTQSRRSRKLSTGTIAMSVGLGLLTGGLGTPQAATAAPVVSAAPAAPQVHPAALAVSQQVAVTAKAPSARVLTEAAKHKGKRYKYGAAGPNRFDCSGYTKYVYKKAVGKKLPHKANLQQRYGKAVSKSKAKPGDLIIIRSGSYGTHAGIYAGGGKMWAAPRTGKTVTKQKIWTRNYVVRRLA